MDPSTQTVSLPSLEQDGELFTLDLGDGENLFNADFLSAVEQHLDVVQAAEPPRALITKATGKFWTNGLDLQWMAANPDQIQTLLARVHGLLARILTLDVPCVAALQGHAFGAGAMLAVAHDMRVMRADRGFFCLPEIDLQIPFSRGMNALLMARLSAQTAHEAMTTGRRYGGTDAQSAGIIDHAVDAEQILPTAIEWARSMAAKSPTTLGAIKRRLYEETVLALTAADQGL